MKAQFECSKLDKTRSLVVLELDLIAFDAPWHFHPELELTYIIEGSGERFVGDSVEPFTAGDLVLLGSKVPHYWQSDSPSATPPKSPPADDEISSRAKALVFHFRNNFADSYPEHRDVSHMLHQQCGGGLKFAPDHRTVDFIRDIPNHQVNLRIPKFLELLTLLVPMKRVALSNVHSDARLDTKANHRISKATEYIHLHYCEPKLSLSDVASAVAMSPSAFSRYFHRITGQTLNRYIAAKRIGRASMLLAETDHSISAIAVRSGFGSLSSFNRQFRRSQNVSPRLFRKKHR